MTWTSRLTYSAPGLSAGDLAALRTTLPNAEIAYEATDGHLQISIDAEGGTLEDAAATALRTAAAATGLLKPSRLYVLPTADALLEAAYPTPLNLDLIGISQIADEFGVSRQRAGQLAADDDFPAPVLTPPSGRLYTRASVQAFHQRWAQTRNPRGGPRRRATPPPGP